MNAVVIHNPKSGSAVPINDFVKRCKKHGIQVLKTIDVTGDLSEELQPYVTEPNIIVIGYGGDGTLNSVASSLRQTGAVFAPIPGGTLNHFTKDLGIPQNLDEALANLSTAKVRYVDIGLVNGHVFLNNSGIGLYPYTLKMREELERSNTHKWIAAIISTIKAFIRYKRMTVEVNNELVKTPFVFVGNNDYKIEQQLVGGRSKLNGNVLSSYAILSKNRLGLILLLLKHLTGMMRQPQDVRIWKMNRMTIRPKMHRIAVSLDGERVVLETPLSYSVSHNELRVLA